MEVRTPNYQNHSKNIQGSVSIKVLLVSGSLKPHSRDCVWRVVLEPFPNNRSIYGILICRFLEWIFCGDVHGVHTYRNIGRYACENPENIGKNTLFIKKENVAKSNEFTV